MAEWQIASMTLSDISGASAVATAVIPANCWVLGVTGEVLSELTSVPGFNIGDSTDSQRFGVNIAPAVGTKTTLAQHTMAGIVGYGVATDVVLTPVTGGFTGGSVRIQVFYATLALGLHGGPWLTATTTLASLSGPTETAVNLIPQGVLVIGVKAEVTVDVTGDGSFTGFDVGDELVQQMWGENVSPTLSTVTDIWNFAATTVPTYTQSTDVVLTAIGGNFTAGSVQLTVYYADLSLAWATRFQDLNLAVLQAASLIQPGEWVIGVRVQVLNAVTGATGISAGDSASADLWGANIPVSAGTISDIEDFLATTPTHYPAGSNAVLSPVGGVFTGGTVRVTEYFSRIDVSAVGIVPIAMAYYRRRRAA